MTAEKKHNSTMDSAGRFLLPASILQDWKAEMEVGFVINRSPDDLCLTLYTMDEWKNAKERLDKLNVLNPENRKYIRYFMGGKTEIKPDSKNRILIPKHLQEYAKLGRELFITKISASIVEIWDPLLYEEQDRTYVANNKPFIQETNKLLFPNAPDLYVS